MMLPPAIATPADPKAAAKHDDDFRIVRLDLAEVAFRVAPAFCQKPIPSTATAGPKLRPRRVFRSPNSAHLTHTASP